MISGQKPCIDWLDQSDERQEITVYLVCWRIFLKTPLSCFVYQPVVWLKLRTNQCIFCYLEYMHNSEKQGCNMLLQHAECILMF